MIDSHCHLDHEPLYKNISEVLKRSKESGVEKILTICTTIKGFNNIKKIISIDDIIYGTFGIHPHETETNVVEKTLIVNNIKKNPKLIGVGETGLDFYYNHSKKLNQIKSFKEHIEAAIDLNFPLIVHSRNAERATFEILNDYKNQNPKILMHCFGGSYDFFKNMQKLNSYFSASGIITFKNSSELQNTFSKIPNDKLLIETDSPFLAPIPMRGKKNEPSFLKYTLKKLSELKNTTEIQMDKSTTKNFETLFLN